MRDECSKYGQIDELKIPRPTGGSRQSAGVGKIFVKFDSVESATGALKALAGRKFSDRTVVTTYFSEVSIVRCLLHIGYVLIWSIGKLRRQCLVERWIPWSSKWLINLRFPSTIYLYSPLFRCHHAFPGCSAACLVLSIYHTGVKRSSMYHSEKYFI